MSIHRILICTLLALTLGACSSTRKAPVASKPVAKAQVRKDYLKPGDIRRVRTGVQSHNHLRIGQAIEAERAGH